MSRRKLLTSRKLGVLKRLRKGIAVLLLWEPWLRPEMELAKWMYEHALTDHDYWRGRLDAFLAITRDV